MLRAVLYARVSDESQVDTWSLDAQRRAFNEMCQKKEWLASEVYCEEGVSAHTDSIQKRPQFKRLLEEAKKHSFDIVVVHSLDRWSRNLGVTIESLKQLGDAKISFVSITENIDYSAPQGRLSSNILGAFAEYFSDSLARHTSKGMKERALSGRPNGDIPFGFRRIPTNKASGKKDEIIIEPKEAEAVKYLFQTYAAGGQSLASLAVWLNGNGFLTRNKRELKDGSGNLVTGPRPFTLYSVRWILHNPFYVGKVKYHGQLQHGLHEAIIDVELFDHVQAKLKVAKNHSKTFSPSYRVYLLKGLARCIYCGYPLWSETSNRGYTYYREPQNSRPHNNCPANGKTISGINIDKQVNDLVKSLTLIPSWKEEVIKRLSIVPEREAVLAQRTLVEGKLKRLARTYTDGLIEEGEYKIQLKLNRDILNSLVIPEEDATIEAGKLLENMSPIWDKATLAEKHKLLSMMLECVFIDLAASRSVVGIQPKPAFYPLFKSLQNQKDNKITVYYAENSKKIESPMKYDSSTVMVETGEALSLPETQDIMMAFNINIFQRFSLSSVL